MATDAEEAIVEGVLKQLVVTSSLSKQLIGLVKTGVGTTPLLPPCAPPPPLLSLLVPVSL